MTMNLFLLFNFLLSCINCITPIQLIPKYEWKSIEFDWDSEEDRQAALDSGDYVPRAAIPADVDQYIRTEDGKIPTLIVFVTLLHTPGVPATLTTVTDKQGPSGPLLRPFPDWSSTRDCSGFTDVHRIAITQCGHLWALDSGVVDKKQICPPKITIFDLDTTTVLNEIEIPELLVKGELVNIIVQPLDDNCESTAAYIADGLGSVLIIYDGESFCRLTAPEFAPEPEAETLKIGDYSVEKETGVVGLSLSPYYKQNVTEQDLFFNPLASYSMYYVNTGELLDYCTTGERPTINKVGGPLSSQSIGQVIDGNDVLYYSSVSETSFKCFSVAKDFNEENRVTLEQNPETLKWVSSIKITPPQAAFGNLLVLSNRYPEFNAGVLDPNETNYRILEHNNYVAMFGTACM